MVAWQEAEYVIAYGLVAVAILVVLALATADFLTRPPKDPPPAPPGTKWTVDGRTCVHGVDLALHCPDCGGSLL